MWRSGDVCGEVEMKMEMGRYEMELEMEMEMEMGIVPNGDQSSDGDGNDWRVMTNGLLDFGNGLIT